MESFRTLALLSLVALSASAQQTTFTVNPTNLTFTDTTAKTVTVTTASGAFALTTISCTAGLTCVFSDTNAPVTGPRSTPFTLRVTPNSVVGNSQQSILLSATGVAPYNIPVTLGSGVGGTGLSVTPSPLVFTYAAGTTTNLVGYVQVLGPGGVPVSISVSGNLAPYLTTPGFANTNDTIPVTLSNPNAIPNGTSGLITFTATNYTPVSVAVQTLQTGVVAGTTLVVSPSAFNFALPAGTNAQQNLNFTVSGVPTGVGFSTAVFGLAGLVVVPSTGLSGSTYTISVLNPASITTAQTGSVVFTPTTAGYTGVTIPVSITPSGSGTTGSIIANPNPIAFNYAAGAGIQTLNVITSGPPANTPFYIAVGGTAAFYVSAPASSAVGSLFQVSVPNPGIVPAGTTGTLTLTPAAPYTPTVIPITINGAGTGFGSLAVNPTTLTFNAALGTGASTPTQFVTVSSNDLTLPSQFFSFSSVSTNNFLTVAANSQTTPATLSVGVNVANITTPGVYTGTITVTGLSTSSLPQTITVTLNVTGTITVTADQTSVAVSVPAGSTTSQTRVVNLTSPSTGVAFTASSSLNFVTVASSSTTFPAALTLTVNPTGIAVGTYTGNITVATGSTTVATIPITVTITPTGTLVVSPTQLAFSYQTSSSTFPVAQAISVTSTGASLPFNAAVTTSTGGNWLQVSSSTGTTPGTVTISVTPTGLPASATPYTGTVTITSSGATNSPITIPVSLTVTTPAVPLVQSIVNAASFGPTTAVPGLIFTIFGRDLGPATLTTLTVANGFVSTTAGGTRVLFDGIPAPIVYSSATQVSAIVPYEISGRFTTRLTVEYNGQTSQPVELRVSDSAPAIFTLNSQGSGQGAILNQDLAPNVPGNPEFRNRSIVIYATGEGQTAAQGSTGRITLPVASDLRRPLLPVSVRIGGRPAVVEYAGSAPGLVAGVIQINARIPSDAPTGPNVPIEIQIGSNTSQLGVTVAVQ